MNKIIKAAEPAVLLAVPAALFWCAFRQVEATAALTLFTVILSMIPFFLHFERKKPRPREMMPVAVLAALAAAGRVLFAAFPNVKPVTAIVILAGCCFGRQSGFLTGALAALASNIFFGQGPWTPWQMYAWGTAGYLAGVLQEKGWLEKKWAVLVFGFLVSLLYGALMDSWYIIGFLAPVTWQKAAAAYGAGLPFSLVHGAATVGFLALAFFSWRRKLFRIRRKYGI